MAEPGRGLFLIFPIHLLKILAKSQPGCSYKVYSYEEKSMYSGRLSEYLILAIFSKSMKSLTLVSAKNGNLKGRPMEVYFLVCVCFSARRRLFFFQQVTRLAFGRAQVLGFT